MNAQVLVHQAALVNREGVAALSCGNGEKAHSCFKNVLEIMGYLTQVPDVALAEDNNSLSLESLTPISTPNIQSDRFFIYNCALLFSPQPSSSYPQEQQQSVGFSQTDVTLFSAVAIFNMALTYNQRALMVQARPPNSSSNSSNHLFRIAARMYDQCLQIVDSLAVAVGDLSVSTLKLIVLNNRSHIYYELQDFEKAQLALGHVRTLSRHIVLNGRSSLVLTEDAFDEIALNVLVTSPPSTAPCA